MNNPIIETIRRAGAERRLLRLTVDRDGIQETRTVEPYSFRPVGTTEKLFFFDLAKGGIRNFRIPNVLSAELLESTFEPRFPVELEASEAAS